MVRNYIKKNERKLWKASVLQNVLRSITHEPKLKIRQASRQFGIPESTLRRYLGKSGERREALGRKPTFTAQEEAELAGHILRLAGMYYGIAPRELRRVVFEFAEAKQINHHFNKKSKMAGRDWMYLFLKRNPKISLRQSEGTKLIRITAFNKDEVNRFFSNLEAVMKKHKFTPHRIYNMDETGIATVQKKCSWVYTAKDKKRVEAVTSGERGRTVTAVFCMNAAGSFIPPMMIFPRVRMDSRLQHNGPLGTVYVCSKNGCTNEVLFCQWLEHFVKHVKPTADDPVLLILDNHSSHVSLAAYMFCKGNNITVVTLPPHTSRRTQPLDLTFFGPLKNVMHREFELYLTSHPYEKIGEHNLAEFLNKAFTKVASMEKGVSGFSSAGIWPLNPDIFDENDFAPPDEDDENVAQNSMTVAELSVHEESDNESVNENVNESVNLSDKSVTSDDVAPPTLAILDTILPTPTKKKTVPGCRRKSRAKMQSEIFTASPQKEKLQKAAEKRKKKEETKKRGPQKEARKEKVQRAPKRGRPRKKQNVEPASDLDSSSDEEAENCVVGPDDQCLICGEPGRDNELWFRCCQCSAWIHAECSGVDRAKDYTCDFCLNLYLHLNSTISSKHFKESDFIYKVYGNSCGIRRFLKAGVYPSVLPNLQSTEKNAKNTFSNKNTDEAKNDINIKTEPSVVPDDEAHESTKRSDTELYISLLTSDVKQETILGL